MSGTLGTETRGLTVTGMSWASQGAARAFGLSMMPPLRPPALQGPFTGYVLMFNYAECTQNLEQSDRYFGVIFGDGVS